MGNIGGDTQGVNFYSVPTEIRCGELLFNVYCIEVRYGELLVSVEGVNGDVLTVKGGDRGGNRRLERGLGSDFGNKNAGSS